MKQFKEWIESQSMEIAKGLGFIIGLIPAAIWLFIFLELFLFVLCRKAMPEIFILQFPITLWVITKKDK